MNAQVSNHLVVGSAYLSLVMSLPLPPYYLDKEQADARGIAETLGQLFARLMEEDQLA